MGYDMRIKGILPEPDAELKERVTKAYMESNAAITAARNAYVAANGSVAGWWDTEEWTRLSGANDKAFEAYVAVTDPGYFSLNMRGMGSYRDVMLALGMAHESASPVQSYEWSDLPDHDDDEAAYYEAADRLTGQHPGDYPTIPSFKFSTNDGWWVTPEECAAAVAQWDAQGIPADLPTAQRLIVEEAYWGRWIEYLRLAAQHDGFRVH